MKITKLLRAWLVKNTDVKEDTSEEDCRKAVASALVDDTLSTEKLQELSKDPAEDEANEFSKRFDAIASGLENLTALLTPNQDKKKEEKSVEKEEKSEEVPKTKAAPSRTAKMISQIGGFADTGSDDSVDVRVKGAVESYSTTKSAMHYPDRTRKGSPHLFAGDRVKNQGVPMDTPSEQEQALSGTWAKFQLLSVTPKLAGSAHRAWERLSDHEKSLLAHLTENGDWDDSRDEKSSKRTGYPGGLKALIDDATSGGIEAAPIVFDDQVIEAPLLYGELYPLVNEVPLDRGRRIEGVAVDRVTAGWGGVDDTAISLFDTSSYVAAFDTTIYRWEGAVKIGLDFLSDSPISFNSIITRQYGERLLEDLDDVIADGDGTTQPEGIMQKSGTTSSAWGSATSIGNYESLRFTIHKREHKPNVKNTAVFCGNETSYSRAKALAVGTTDARRLFGSGNFGTNGYDDYRIMDRPYKINESLGNTEVFYAILARYRMYRRKGIAVRTSTEGDTLIRANEMLIAVMARYGGQLERAACAGKTTTAPA